MANNNDAVNTLRKAVEVSPDNVPLRVHLADTLHGLSRYEDAQQEYTTALSLDPDNDQVKLGLASTFFQLGKYMQALVITEALIESNSTPPAAYLLHSRMLLTDGQVEKAVQEYKRAIEKDPSLMDESLSERLGVGAHEGSDVVDGRIREHVESDNAFDVNMEHSKTKFADVGGMDAVKEQIRMKIIYPLTNPDVYKAYGKKMGGGILMYGPPGCGKTHLARATAGEINAIFVSVGINEVLDMWIGGSERNLHDIFDSARRNTPCVLFFDEVDALAASRSSVRHGTGGRHIINQFLAELDGVDTSNEGVLILAATNAPWHLDSAFRRPGRFDRIIFVPPPDKPARTEILRIMLQGKPTENIDYDYLAKKTENFSGADLHALIDQTLEKKIEQAMKDGKPKPITTKDLDLNLKDVRPSTAEWFATAKNYALYSNEGGAYDDIRKYLKI
jgi:transitional endoplasmic reticulum ATPase